MVLNERKIESIVRKVLNEAIGFSLGYLKSLSSLKERLVYCKEMLGKPIGRGSSRICFQLDDERILKLAVNEKGLAQNEKEGRYDYFRDSYGIFPKVYYDLSDTENYTFLVSEYVLPAKRQDFIECLGISPNGFYGFLRTCASVYGKSTAVMNRKKFDGLIKNNEALEQWYDYMCNYEVDPIDLRISNFGIALRNGEPEIVMLDNGLDMEIYNKYYKRW